MVSGDPARGLQDLELAMTLDPLATSGWHQMGLRRRLLREPEKARDALWRALEIGRAISELAILDLALSRRDPWLRYARDSFWLEPLHADP